MKKSITLALTALCFLTSCSLNSAKNKDEQIYTTPFAINPSVTYKVVRDFGVNDEVANTFLKPQSLDLGAPKGPDEYPVTNNVSYIYFDSTNNNSTATSSDPSYTISVKVPNTIGAVQILNSKGGYQFVENFHAPDFTYIFTDMRVGKNIYLVRAYSTNKIAYEDLFTVYYYPPKTEEESFKKVETLPEPEEQYEECGPYFREQISETGNKEWLFMPSQYGQNVQKLALEDGINFLYAHKNGGENPAGEIRFENTQNNTTSQSKSIYLGCGMFQTQSMQKISPGEYLLTTTAGHEGEGQEYYYNAKTGVLLEIMDLVKKLDGKDAYQIFSVDVTDKNIILTEHKYCCDYIPSSHGFETIIFSKEGHFISRTPIKV